MSEAHSSSSASAIRRLATIVVLLLIGGTTTMGSVLVCVVASNSNPKIEVLAKEKLAWRRAVPTDWPQPTDGIHFHTTGVDCAVLMAMKGAESPSMAEYRAGVPVECCEGWTVGDSSGRSSDHFVCWLRRPWAGGVTLPFLPLWPGFAINTLFYAAIAWGLWQVPLAIRRRRRRRNGLCVRCGCDLKGLAHGSPCPECGTTPS